jgi:hypothetical protein
VKALGATPIHFDGLHDISTIKEAASQHDGWLLNITERELLLICYVYVVAISCASSMDLESCTALVQGLGERKQKTGQEGYYIHVSKSHHVCIAKKSVLISS